jgi:hypothetical protein
LEGILVKSNQRSPSVKQNYELSEKAVGRSTTRNPGQKEKREGGRLVSEIV